MNKSLHAIKKIPRFTENPAITVTRTIPLERAVLQLVLERVVAWEDYLPAFAQLEEEMDIDYED